MYINIYICASMSVQHICCSAPLFIATKAYQQRIRIRIADSRQVANPDLATTRAPAGNSSWSTQLS